MFNYYTALLDTVNIVFRILSTILSLRRGSHYLYTYTKDDLFDDYFRR